MISRRTMMVSSAAIAGIMAIGAGTGFGHLNQQGVLLFTDDTAKGYEFGKGIHWDADIVLNDNIPTAALADLNSGVAWLEAVKGSVLVVAIDARKALLFDEILREARVRILYNGEHTALEVNRGPVRHSAVELPVSEGLTSSLPREGAWMDELMAKLLLVARREWSAGSHLSMAGALRDVNIKEAKVSLATYVIKA